MISEQRIGKEVYGSDQCQTYLSSWYFHEDTEEKHENPQIG
jgi:hypothetical protein